MTTHSTGNAPWQVEIDCGPGKPAEYVSIKALKLTPRTMMLVLPDGEQRSFKITDVRKLLVMRTKTGTDMC